MDSAHDGGVSLDPKVQSELDRLAAELFTIQDQANAAINDRRSRIFGLGEFALRAQGLDPAQHEADIRREGVKVKPVASVPNDQST